MTNPVYDVDSFQGRDDTETLNSTTFSETKNTTWTQDSDTAFRIRFLVQETAGGMGANKTLQLAYNYESAGMVDVNASSTEVQSVVSGQYAEDDTTTQVLGAGTYAVGESLGADEVDGITGNIDFAGSDEAEMEYCVQIIGSAVNDAETIIFEIRDGVGGAALPETVTLTLTINKVAAAVATVSNTIINQAVMRASNY